MDVGGRRKIVLIRTNNFTAHPAPVMCLVDDMRAGHELRFSLGFHAQLPPLARPRPWTAPRTGASSIQERGFGSTACDLLPEPQRSGEDEQESPLTGTNQRLG